MRCMFGARLGKVIVRGRVSDNQVRNRDMFQRCTLPWITRALLAAACCVVSLGRLQAQNPAAARVVAQIGQVSVMENGYARALSVGMDVSPAQVIVTGPDSFARFQVSDGSTFEVYANARIVFRETMGDWKHLLNVWIGRVKV